MNCKTNLISRKCQSTVKEDQQHESNDVLPIDEFSRERHLLGRWRLWDNFLPEVTHLFLRNQSHALRFP